MASLTAVCLALAMLASATQASSTSGLDNTFGEVHPDEVSDLLGVLRSRILGHGQKSRDFEDEEHSKLELKLRDALLLFRDKLTEPLPELGLPTLDPFVYSGNDTIEVDNKFASLKVTLMRAFSEGVSKFKVDKLSLYLVEREGVLELTLPGFQFNVVADIPQGSWVSPLQIHLDDRLKVSFSSPVIKLGLRGKISVKNARLSMQSTRINVDLGKWDLGFECLREGMCTRNEGLYDVLAALCRELVPRVLADWLPVAEKVVNKKLDEKLQEFQISDLVPDLS